ncbi:MAG: hypothetical protein HY670_01660 [Chloroflexi bacterium]|nr:hypothetical protein [Chloroflexota bacterium]
MAYYGHVGGILYVDLSTGRIEKRRLDSRLAEKFIGGPGIGFRLLYDLLKPGVDPLSPENVMIFGAGPLLGLPLASASKCYMATKYAIPAAPDKAKYFVSASMSGGNAFALMMKKAGYDHIVITGQAPGPSYLKVTDKDVEICDAGDLWGKNIEETGKILRQRHRTARRNCGTAVIGRAGENLVRLAGIHVDDWHTAGRYAGAVMGSKNLKAIVTLGEGDIQMADKEGFLQLAETQRREIKCLPSYSVVAPAGTSKWGTIFRDTMIGAKACCDGIDACKSIHEIKEGQHKGELFGGIFFPEAREVITRLGVKDHWESYKLLGELNRLGLCELTVTRMMRFVTALYQRGIITKKDTGGLALEANLDTCLTLAEKVASREDIGAIMGEGWYTLARAFGVDPAADWENGAPIIKGVDLLVDNRVWPSLYQPASGFGPGVGLGPIVHAKTKHTHAATYWSHQEMSFAEVVKDFEKMGATETEKARVFTESRFNTGRLERFVDDAETVYNCLGICDTAVHWCYDATRDVPFLAQAYTLATGLPITPRELLRAGERVWNLERLLNAREGFDRWDDKIPDLYIQNTKIPLKAREGDRYLCDWFGQRLTKADMVRMLDDYYDERGWDIKTGLPTKGNLTELGLGEMMTVV